MTTPLCRTDNVPPYERTFSLPLGWPGGTLPFAVGDVVSVHIEPTERAHGYNPCADGTLARVIGYDAAMFGPPDNPVRFGEWPGWVGPWVNTTSVSLLTEAGARLVIFSGRLRLVEASHLTPPARATVES